MIIKKLSRIIGFSFLGISLSFAGGDITITDRGRDVDFVVSQDETSVRSPGGLEKLFKFKTKSKNSSEVMARVRKKSKASGDSYDLVLYPEGKENVETARRIVRPQMLVFIKSGADVQALAKRMEATVQLVKTSKTMVLLNFTDSVAVLEQLAKVRDDRAVVSANPILARKVTKRAIPTDPRFRYTATNRKYQWHLYNTGQNGGTLGIDANVINAWDSYTGQGVTIGIIDDGLQVAHPDLIANANTDIDHNWNDGDPDDPTPPTAADSHGTAVGGVAAASWNNNEGGSGSAPEAELVGLRLIAGQIGDTVESEALGWETGIIDIYNNSWGPPDNGLFFDSGPLVKATLLDGCTTGRGGLGVIYLWAGGNGRLDDDNSNYDGYANSIHTISIGAVTDTGEQSPYSESGANLVVVAPSNGGGQGITTTEPFNIYTDNFGGTSSATPLASGVVALILEANPNLGWRDVQEILMRSARQIIAWDNDWIENAAFFHFNHKFGAGMVDAEAAVALAKTWVNLEPATQVNLVQNGINEAIPEGGATLTKTFDFTLEPNLRVEHVQVRINASHPNSRDLICTLVSPSNTESILSESSTRVLETDIPDWTFMSVRNWGEDSAGVWQVKVRDVRAGAAGTLDDIEIIIHGVDTPREVPPIVASPSQVGVVVDNPLTYTLVVQLLEDAELATALPPGLSYDADSMTISGVPTEIGVTQVLFNLTNEWGLTEFVLTIYVAPPPSDNIAGAIEQDGVSVTTSGSGGLWELELIDTSDGSDAIASSMGLPNYGEAHVRVPHDGGGVVLFNWKVSSEEGFDRLWFYPTGTGLQNWAGFISGETNWGTFATKLPKTARSLTWSYIKDRTGSSGDDRGFLDQVRFETVEDYAAKLTDYSGSDLEFDLDVQALWIPIDMINSPDGKALQASAIGNGQYSDLKTLLQGPGILKFQWMVSSERNDKLQFYIGGAPRGEISGNVGWQEMSYVVGDGPVGISWRYLKNASFSGGTLDSGLVDSISFTKTYTYDTWASGQFSDAEMLDPEISGEEADPNSNGINNLLEYAFGGNPKVIDGSLMLPGVVFDEDGYGFTFQKNVGYTDIEYIMEESTNLTDWATVDGALVSTEGSIETYRYELMPTAGDTERFLRVRVVK